MLNGRGVENKRSAPLSCIRTEMMHRFTLLVVTLTAFLCAARAGQPVTQPEESSLNAVSKAFRNAKSRGGSEFSITNPGKKSQRKKTADIIAELKDDDILVDIGGVFKLKWKIIRRHVETLCKNIDRPDMQEEGNEAVKKIAFQSMFRKLLKDYIEHGVFALEARRLGIKVEETEFQKYRKMARERYAQMGEVGKGLTGLMDSGESFYEHNLTNALYWKAYREKEIEPKIELPNEDVRKFMGMRHEKNLNVLATNNIKRVLIVDILAKLKGGMDFGDAAEKWSDDDSSETRGVMMDDHGEVTLKFEKDDLDERIADQCWQMKVGEMSGVIETPYAWHIVKVLKRNPATADNEETIEFAQIKLEKEFLEPEFSEEEARDKAKALILRAAMKTKFAELLKLTHIDSKIPLSDGGGKGGPRMKVQKVR